MYDFSKSLFSGTSVTSENKYQHTKISVCYESVLWVDLCSLGEPNPLKYELFFQISSKLLIFKLFLYASINLSNYLNLCRNRNSFLPADFQALAPINNANSKVLSPHNILSSSLRKELYGVMTAFLYSCL
jgi:hypothetical protein